MPHLLQTTLFSRNTILLDLRVKAQAKELLACGNGVREELSISNPEEAMEYSIASTLVIPGGNDTLIIYGLRGMAVHAPVAIVCIMITIALVLKLNSKNLFPLVWRQ